MVHMASDPALMLNFKSQVPDVTSIESMSTHHSGVTPLKAFKMAWTLPQQHSAIQTSPMMGPFQALHLHTLDP